MLTIAKYFSFLPSFILLAAIICPLTAAAQTVLPGNREQDFFTGTGFGADSSLLGNFSGSLFQIPGAESQKIVASDGATADQFGTSVDIEGDTMIIGAPSADIQPGVSQGAAYIFIRRSNDWVFQTKLNAVNGTINEIFGNSVAISGDTAIIGAPFADVGNNSDQGVVYIFTRSGSTWAFEQKITAADGIAGSQLGTSVALDGDTAVIGATGDRLGGLTRGSAYIFKRTAGIWTQEAKVFDSGGTFGTRFGFSVGVDNDTAVVGGLSADATPGVFSGIACVYQRSAGVWSQQARLFDPAGENDDLFGSGVAADTDTIIVGAPAARTISGLRTGAVYFYARTGDSWLLQQKMPGNDTLSTDKFGTQVALSGNLAIVGAPLKSLGSGTLEGAAYIFAKNGENWSQQAKLLASDAFPGDRFGSGVAVDGNKFVVGAPLADIGSNNSQGVAYFFIKPTFAPDLQPASDTGISNTDNVTSRQNLTFDIGGVTTGATVELLRDGVAVGSITAASTTVTFSDSNLPADGVFHYTARQIVNNEVSSMSEVTPVTIDNTAPSVSINQRSDQLDPTNSPVVHFSTVFSEPVTGFDVPDVSLAGSTADLSSANVTVTGSGANYDVSISNYTAENLTIRASVNALATTDLAGNASSASTSVDNTITVDNVGPKVTINQAASQVDPTATLPLAFTVVFSEPVTNFDNSDILFTGSTANTGPAIVSISGSGLVYNVTVSNIISNGLIVRASIRAGGVQDQLGNGNDASTSTDNTVTLDNVAPSVAINQATTQIDPTASLPVNFTVLFNEPVTGFDNNDISLAGSTANVTQASINISGSGTTYTVAVGNIVSNGGFIQARILSGAAQDALGNLSSASTSTDNRVTVDNVAPSVTVNQAPGQSDPALTQPVNFLVVFSETITGLTASDFSYNGSTAEISNALLNVSGSGNTYTVSVRNITSNGELKLSLPAGAAIDSLGNASTASTSSDNSVTIAFKKSVFDFDGDGKTDIGIFRPSDGSWWYSRSSDNTVRVFSFGTSTDILTPGDFTGDGKADLGIFRPSTGEWFIQRSEDNSFFSFPFGASGDLPAPADYDNDGKTDAAVFRPSSATWFILKSGGGTSIVQFGTSEDKPVPSDYDGDGKTDIAIFRPSDGSWWYIRSIDGQFRVFSFGVSTDKPVPGDYTGDGKADIAIFRPSTGEWFVQRSEDNSYFSFPFGAAGDVPVPGDYDGDGKFDPAVFRPSSNTWFINRTTAGILITSFGATGDRPIPSVFAP
jgi:hypothetical protein